jgi:hypothetical protein
MTTSFVSDKGVREEIKKLVTDTDEFVLAVAFWGKGALQQLGLDKLRSQQKGTIICNLMSGACNPNEINKLIKLVQDSRSNLKVLKHEKLHAKVYWSPSCVILGSSNASSNGLTFEGKELAGSVEGNVKILDPKTNSDVKEWISGVTLSATEISKLDMKIAASFWKQRRRDRHTGGKSKDSLSFLQKFKEQPDYFTDTLPIQVWIYNAEDMDLAGKKAFNEAKKEHPNFDDAYQNELGEKNPEAGTRVIDALYEIKNKKLILSEPTVWQILPKNHIYIYPKPPKIPAGKLLLCEEIKDIERHRVTGNDKRELKKLIEVYIEKHPQEKETSPEWTIDLKKLFN